MILLDVMRAAPSRWDFRKKRKTALGSELLLAEQTRLLEMIARGCGLRECLEALTESTSRLAPAARSAILVANEQRSLMADAVSVHLPAGFSLSVRGLPIDELPIGTCGEAIREGRVVSCTDIESGSEWSPAWRSLCLSHGVKACRSEPVFGQNGRAIASFFLCLKQPRPPDEWELSICRMSAHVAGVMLERDRIEKDARDTMRLQRVLARISEHYAIATTGNVFLDAVVTELATSLGVSRAGLALVDREANTLTLVHEFHAADLPSIRATYDTSAYPSGRLDAAERGTTQSPDLASDPAGAAVYKKYVEKLGLRAYINVPLKREGLWRANFWVAHHLPYDWRAADIKLVEFAAERAWSFYELKRSEAAAQDAIDQLRRVTENAQIGLTRFDRSLRYLAANSAYARIVGLPLDQIIGRRVDEVLGEEAFKAIRPHVQMALAGKSGSYEQRLPLSETHAPSMSPTAPDVDLKGEVTGWVASIADVTDRKLLEIERERHQRTFREMVERAPFGIYTVNSELRFVQANATAREGAFKNVRPLLGMDLEPAMRVLWPEDVAASVIETFKHTLSTGKAYFSRDFVSQRADIEAVEGYEWELHRLTLPDGTQGTICYYFDATDLRSAQQALEEAERVKSAQLSELENLYRTSPIGLAVLDGDGRFLRINQALADMNGLPLEAHIGRIAWDLIPNLRRAVEPVLKRVIENSETIVAEIVATTPRWHNQERTWKETGYPVRNVEGAKVAGGVIVEDITDQKKAEETRQLLVHELNHRAKNMLAMVQSIAHQSLRHARDHAEFGESFMGRLQSLARAHTLLTQSDWRSADVSTVAKNQLMLDVESDPRIALSGPKVFLTPQLALQLSLILHELATNARKHGSLRASHGEVHLTWTLNNARPDKTLGFRWEERCGEARPEAVAGAGGGGFGMTLIKSLSSAGATLTDRPDGILWEFALPWRETAPSPLRLGLAPGASTRRDADVDIAGLDLLLVEDEPLISMDLQARLEGVGVHVVGPAGSISEALELLRAGGRVEMALLDMNLRGDSVEPVARQLGEKQIPFAYLTGYGNAPLAQEAKVPIIPKPFDFAQVIEVLRSLRERRA